MKLLPVVTVGLLLSLALIGCAVQQHQAVIEVPATAAAMDDLKKVRASYAAGQYGDVIRAVSRSGELTQAPMATRIEAMKLQAFSYCLTHYMVLCEAQFERIFALDPHFELSPAERGHPLWGPVYEASRPAATTAGR